MQEERRKTLRGKRRLLRTWFYAVAEKVKESKQFNFRYDFLSKGDILRDSVRKMILGMSV